MICSMKQGHGESFRYMIDPQSESLWLRRKTHISFKNHNSFWNNIFDVNNNSFRTRRRIQYSMNCDPVNMEVLNADKF